MNYKYYHELSPFYTEYYEIRNYCYILTDNDKLLQNELLESYQHILNELSQFDMSIVLGKFDDTYDPHLMIYFWNYIFKPFKDRIYYDDYDKMISRFLLANITSLSKEDIDLITTIMLPFVLYIKRKFKYMVCDENIMINITPYGKWTKMYKNKSTFDENGKFNKIDLFIQGDFDQFNNSFTRKYYY